jgi:hypothetical protein
MMRFKQRQFTVILPGTHVPDKTRTVNRYTLTLQIKKQRDVIITQMSKSGRNQIVRKEKGQDADVALNRDNSELQDDTVSNATETVL